jgi:hypothetical protein
VLAVLFAVLASTSLAQTTNPDDGIDVEIYDPASGSNRFCVSPGATITARTYVRPGLGTTSCTLSCGSGISGGSANIATAVIDISFATAHLSLVSAMTNPDTSYAAVDGLIQDNSGEGRIGWALAGDWTINADPSSALKNPCDMMKLDAEGWVLQTVFQATGTGLSSLHLRRQTDPLPFALSLADICGSDAFSLASGDIEEVRDAAVMVANQCADVIFFDTFGTGSTMYWDTVVSD